MKQDEIWLKDKSMIESNSVDLYYLSRIPILNLSVYCKPKVVNQGHTEIYSRK